MKDIAKSKLTEAQAKLVADNYDLIDMYMRIHHLSYSWEEDWHGIFSCVLCRAAMRYDETKGVSFRTYAYVILDYTRRKTLKVLYTLQKRPKNVCSLDRQIVTSIDTDRKICFADTIPSCEDEYDIPHLIDVRNAYSKALTNFDRKYHDRVVDYFENGMTMEEIGNKNGMTRQAVQWVMGRFVRSLKANWGRD